jgi:hypothetical protein
MPTMTEANTSSKRNNRSRLGKPLRKQSTEHLKAATPTKAPSDETMEGKAVAVIRQRYPDAEDVTYLETREFLDGKLVVVTYTFDAEEEEDSLAYIYFDGIDKGWMPRVCEYQDEMANLVNDLRYRSSGRLSHKITDYVFREGGAAVAIALVLLAVLAYAMFTGHQSYLDEKFWNVFLLVVGFYFGANAPAKTRS